MADVDQTSPLVTIVSGAVATLSGVVVFLWRQITTNYQKTETKLDLCEQTHYKTQELIVGLTREVGELKGRQQGIDELAKEVLKAVTKKEP